jgi:hypothetical protein
MFVLAQTGHLESCAAATGGVGALARLAATRIFI